VVPASFTGVAPVFTTLSPSGTQPMHALAEEEPGALYRPDPQLEQSLAAVPPVLLRYVPPTQRVHTDAPAADQDPAAQDKHLPPLPLLPPPYFPATHCTHVSLSASEP